MVFDRVQPHVDYVAKSGKILPNGITRDLKTDTKKKHAAIKMAVCPPHNVMRDWKKIEYSRPLAMVKRRYNWVENSTC